MDRKLSLLGFAVMFLIGSDTFVVAPLLPSLAKTYDVSTTQSGWLVSIYAIGYALTGQSRTEVTAGSSLRLGWWFSHWQQSPVQFRRGSGQCSPSVLSLAVRRPLLHRRYGR